MSGSGDHRGRGPPGSDAGWETIGKKSKKPGQAAGKQWAPWGSTNAAPNTARPAWGGNGSSHPSGTSQPQSSDRGAANRGNPRPPPQIRVMERELQAPRPVVTPPLANGWQWQSRSRPSASEGQQDDAPPPGGDPDPEEENVDGNGTSDDDDDLSDDISDEYDSDASEKSFEIRKMNKWFKAMAMSGMQKWTWAIDWYNGLQPLMTHARTKGSTKVRLHRELAALLEEELSHRGTSMVPAGEQFGKWKGHSLKGMGNQELLNYFGEYAATKARHAYGPGGHRGMSVLIFESSAVGCMEAERLHRHFVTQGTGREGWQFRKVRFLPGGKRQLYGFLANKEDMETFNKNSQGKGRLKYEMRSYNEMVVIPMKQMSEDNQQLNYLKNKMVKTEQRSKAVEETLGVVTQRLRETMEEMIFVRDKAKEKHSEYKQEMKYQEEFFHNQIEIIYKAREDEEKEFEKLLQEERSKARRFDVDSGTTEVRKLRKEHVQKFIDGQVKGVAEFEAERDELIKTHEEKKMKLKKEYMEKEVELEKELDAALTGLIDKHKPDTFQASNA
ncbi:hypothetical protein SETIT_7G276300v2 [Setaria italica]|uniref:XS domain-containing protein n=1 Tax=Setaria italica TaxID=4555 RepID=A0A368S0F8_SETIT|nr:hypothetical protein SETIT_7G276300v2 [Setaria italica]